MTAIYLRKPSQFDENMAHIIKKNKEKNIAMQKKFSVRNCRLFSDSILIGYKMITKICLLIKFYLHSNTLNSNSRLKNVKNKAKFLNEFIDDLVLYENYLICIFMKINKNVKQ